MTVEEMLLKIKNATFELKKEKENIIIKNDKKILKYEKLKIGLINISTLNDIISKRDIKKKDMILEIFDDDKKLNIFICVENNISD